MKGMQKIKRGRGFRGVVDYCLADKNARLLFLENIAADDPTDIARELIRTTKIKNPEKPTWHNSLRLPRGEKLSDEKWEEIAREYMAEMGFTENHAYAVFMHDDPAGQHVHIVASRVGLDGALYLGQNENLRSTKIIRKLEAKYGLQQTHDGADT
ncbi:relaxase/mobilization nuclease domain protein, partial [mine drainage metagenome]